MGEQHSQNDRFVDLEHALDYRFKNQELLMEALTHSSFVNESKSHDVKDNERLEFFGDAALDFFVTAKLMREFPESREGELSRIRASVVDEASLSKLALRIELGRFLRLGRGEEKGGGRAKPSLLANAYEAVIAALYIDGGPTPVHRLVERDFAWLLAERRISNTGQDYKTDLQELVQARYGTVPSYELQSVSGPGHRLGFTVKVLIGAEVFGEGSGQSKKAAEQAAAKVALQRIGTVAVVLTS